MRKKFLCSAALMLLVAAPLMTSCNNSLDEVAPAEETKSNIVTITIAPPVAEPETRVTMEETTNGIKITGWEDGKTVGEKADEVTLYKLNKKPDTTEDEYVFNGEGVTFRCIDAAAGTFIADLGAGNIDDYTFAVFGADAVKFFGENYPSIALVPKTMCSENLKDVVIMVAYKNDEGAYSMEVANNVLKFSPGTISSNVEVAWTSIGYGSSAGRGYRLPFSFWGGTHGNWLHGIMVYQIPDAYTGWGNAKPFTLKAGVVSYVNMGMVGHSNDSWGLAKEDGTEVLPIKFVGTSKMDVKGKLYIVKNPSATLSIMSNTGYDSVDW